MKCKIFSDQKFNDKALKDTRYLFKYYPYYGGTNPNFDQYSGLLLDVKEQFKRGIDPFTKILKSQLSYSEEYVICVIPSHEVGIKLTGIKTIAKILCVPPIIDGTNLIIRTKEMPKKATGGIRDLQSEIDSLTINNKKIIKNKQVLLLDDITTTGTSLNAGKQILEDAGAEIVATLALGKTQ